MGIDPRTLDQYKPPPGSLADRLNTYFNSAAGIEDSRAAALFAFLIYGFLSPLESLTKLIENHHSDLTSLFLLGGEKTGIEELQRYLRTKDTFWRTTISDCDQALGLDLDSDNFEVFLGPVLYPPQEKDWSRDQKSQQQQ